MHPFNAISLATVLLLPCAAGAAEGQRFRHPAVGQFGGDIAAQLTQPGFFGTIAASFTEVRGITGNDGNQQVVPARMLPLPTGTPTGGAVRDGTFSLQVPAGLVNLEQTQYQLNLMAGYVTQPLYAGGSFVFRANLPFVYLSRSFSAVQGAGVITPTPAAPLPANAIAAVNTVGAAVNAQVQASLAAAGAIQNLDASGIGDLELSAAWVKHAGPWRYGAGLTLHLPTGSYDAGRGPNPGLGDFRTVQVGASAAYTFPGTPWSVAARAGVGTNSTNTATNFRSGDFQLAEVAVARFTSGWLVGANLLAIRQRTDDKVNGAAVLNTRYRANAAGPFATHRIEGTPFSINVHVSRTFGERNAVVLRTAQVRLVGTF